MKKAISCFAALAMVLTMLQFGVISSDALTSGDYIFTINGDLEATITDYIGSGGAIVIPDNLDGYTVTAIGSGAFYDCDSITGAIIPDTVKSIGSNAFDYCDELTGVTIGSGVTSIGSSAFDICPKLTAAYFLGNAPSMGYNVFGPGSNATYAQAYRTYVFYLSGSTGFEDNSSTYYPPYDPYDPYNPYNPYDPYPPGGGFISPGFPSNRWYGYGTATFSLATLLARSGSGASLNLGNGFMYGLKPGLTQTILESTFVRISGSGILCYPGSNGTFGTGTTVELLDKITSKVTNTYKIVIFGDINGDGNIDGIDASNLVNLETYAVAWDPVVNAANYKAGDLNGDGNVDSIDAGLMVDAENYALTVNQTTGLTTVV